LAARQLRAIWPGEGWLLNEQRLTVDGDGIASEAIRKGRTSPPGIHGVPCDVSEMAELILPRCDGAESLVVPARSHTRPCPPMRGVTLARERIAQAAAA
jgi:hypothetical protein